VGTCATVTTAELAHLEELAVDVARVLSRVEAVTEVVGGLVVGVDLDRLVDLVAQEPQQTDDVQRLDGAVGQRDELGLARRHRVAVLAARRVRDAPAGEHDDETGCRVSRGPVGVGIGAQLLGAVRVRAERGANLLGVCEVDEHALEVGVELLSADGQTRAAEAEGGTDLGTPRDRV